MCDRCGNLTLGCDRVEDAEVATNLLKLCVILEIKDTKQIRIVCLNKIHVNNIDNYVMLNIFYRINSFDTHYIAHH